MADEEAKSTISELTNALQTVAILSERLRRELSDSSQQAVELEAASWRATVAVRKLRPPKDE